MKNFLLSLYDVGLILCKHLPERRQSRLVYRSFFHVYLTEDRVQGPNRQIGPIHGVSYPGFSYSKNAQNPGLVLSLLN